jgi:hypothetical protein
MLEMIPTSIDALILAALTCAVFYELVDVAAPRLLSRIRVK